MKLIHTLTITIALSSVVPVCAQEAYKNPNLTPQERAKDLIGRLTIEEKAQLMLDISKPIPRFGIKTFNWWSEALHGVANQDNVTVFPEPIGMAASFNEKMVRKVFDATSDEFRAKYNAWLADGNEDQRFHSISVWTPNINIFRDPRWGRGQETYGEDPYLTSVMGAEVIRGLQGPEDTKYRKLYACAKHFAIHSGPEYTRHTANITDVTPRDLWETYLPAFKVAVQDANVREVMCAYQRWDDEPCCGNSRLLQQILRDEWGFKYLVVSDCGALTDFWDTHKSSSDAVHSVRPAALAGTDVECGYDYVYKNVPEAVRLGLVSEKDIDVHLQRLLEGRFELGEMDDPSLVEWSKIPISVVNCEKHQQIALDMARQSLVLLKNGGKSSVLPLNKNEKIAVIGPNANNTTMMWGNYNGTPAKTINILEGIQQKIGADKVVYFQGCDFVNEKNLTSFFSQCSIDGQQGMKARFWNSREFEGDIVATRRLTEPIVETTYGQHAFAPNVNLTDFGAEYETEFVAPRSCEIVFNLEASSYFELIVNGESLVKNRTWLTIPTRTTYNVEAGKKYNIKLRFAQIENYNANLKFDFGEEHDVDYKGLIEQLSDCNTVVFVGGISPKHEGEEMPVNLKGFKGGDRTDIELPTVQRQFLKELHDAGKTVVYVNCSGSAIALEPETKTCDAILQVWYAGERGGTAIADVLYGDYNPCGKLPVTFYKNTDQLPDYEDYSMKGRTYRYMNDALYPFGYGLSYTKFNVGKASIKNDNLLIPVTNTGKKDGVEVIQVYVKKDDDVNGPLKSLRAYKREEFASGETKNVSFAITPKMFEFFDEQTNTMCVTSGAYTIYYGTSSDDKDLKTLKYIMKD